MKQIVEDVVEDVVTIVIGVPLMVLIWIGQGIFWLLEKLKLIN